jgi:ribonuclease HI
MLAAEEQVRAAQQTEEREKNENVIPLSVTPARPAPVRAGEETAYEADAEGQLLLC